MDPLVELFMAFGESVILEKKVMLIQGERGWPLLDYLCGLDVYNL